MSISHVVVDGSNIATEGRSDPTLAQLDEAVRAFMDEHDPKKLTVVVDATFGHRIPSSERAEYDAGIENGELVSPPAGAIGRGDAFVLEIADRSGATVLSNDSFQEFHGDYGWLFDEGRLIGGKPVPEVGWVFVWRTPVRGPASRKATQAAKRTTKKRATKAATKAAPTKKKATKKKAASKKATTKKAAPTKKKATKKKAAPAETKATAKKKAATKKRAAAEESAPTKKARRTRKAEKAEREAAMFNPARAFKKFSSAHPVGSRVQGTVDRFSSHGAHVKVDTVDCYVPLRAMGDPAPRSAREVLTIDETREFVVDAVDTERRGVDLALPSDG